MSEAVVLGLHVKRHARAFTTVSVLIVMGLVGSRPQRLTSANRPTRTLLTLRVQTRANMSASRARFRTRFAPDTEGLFVSCAKLVSDDAGPADDHW
jgi:hypothetical protein